MTRWYSDHQLSAAVTVARLIDAAGNQVVDVHGTYRQAATQGEHPSDDLRDAEQVLVSAGLLVEAEGRLVPVELLHALAVLDDATALLVLRGRLDPLPPGVDDLADDRGELGAAGEEHVAEICREELRGLGRADLSDRVQRVSLISDALGYDVNAPTLGAATRRLEVKTQGSNAAATVRFFLSRNEYEVGRRHTTSWALVMCCAPTGPSGAVEICGWCRADSLALYLPDDRNGRWTEAMVRMPTVALAAGFPPAV